MAANGLDEEQQPIRPRACLLSPDPALAAFHMAGILGVGSPSREEIDGRTTILGPASDI